MIFLSYFKWRKRPAIKILKKMGSFASRRAFFNLTDFCGRMTEFYPKWRFFSVIQAIFGSVLKAVFWENESTSPIIFEENGGAGKNSVVSHIGSSFVKYGRLYNSWFLYWEFFKKSALLFFFVQNFKHRVLKYQWEIRKGIYNTLKLTFLFKKLLFPWLPP